MAPASEIDINSPFRGIPRLVELVRFVVGTDPDNETDWLEWKVGVDLTRPAGRFEVARQIIGFANREVGRATQHAGGCGLLVLGAEPGKLAGQSAMDPADLDAAVRPYIGDDGPVWQPFRVEVDEASVLVVTVEPPRWGDSVHCLRKEYSAPKGVGEPERPQGGRDGTVFIRGLGNVHQASSVEMRMLQARLLNRPDGELAIVVETLGDPLRRVDLSEVAVGRWLDAERGRLLAPLEEHERQKVAQTEVTRPAMLEERARLAPALEAMQAAQRAAREYSRMQSLLGMTTVPEDRSPDDYREEVDGYLSAARAAVIARAWNNVEDVVESYLAIKVTNASSRNLESVELEVSIPGNVATFEEIDEVSMPPRPRPWGPRPKDAFLGFGASIGQLRVPSFDLPSFKSRGYTAQNGGSTRIEFAPVDLRPHKSIELDEVPLVVSASESGTLKAAWSATARNRDGRSEGVIEIALSEVALTAEDLLDDGE